MALYRLRAHMRLKKSTANNAADNQSARHDRAATIRAGTVAEEPKHLSAVDVGGGKADFVCDLPLSDETDAADGYALLADLLPDSEPVPVDGGSTRPSWVERHTCQHEDTADTVRACVVDEFAEGPS